MLEMMFFVEFSRKPCNVVALMKSSGEPLMRRMSSANLSLERFASRSCSVSLTPRLSVFHFSAVIGSPLEVELIAVDFLLHVFSLFSGKLCAHLYVRLLNASVTQGLPDAAVLKSMAATNGVLCHSAALTCWIVCRGLA